MQRTMPHCLKTAAGYISTFVVVLVAATRYDLELTTGSESNHHVTGWRPEHALPAGGTAFVVPGTGTTAKLARFAGDPRDHRAATTERVNSLARWHTEATPITTIGRCSTIRYTAAGVIARRSTTPADEPVSRVSEIDHCQQQQRQSRQSQPEAKAVVAETAASQAGAISPRSVLLTSIGRHSDGDSKAMGQGLDGDVRETGKLAGLLSQLHAEAGGGSGGSEWCHRAAAAAACEAEPRLTRAVRAFESRHPDATIILLALAGSRLYGTHTPESDLDVRGLYIPAATPAVAAAAATASRDTPKTRRDQHGRKKRNKTDGTALGKNQPQQRQRPKKLSATSDQGFPLEEAFWYSTSDCSSANTVEDVDMEMLSLDKFFVQLLRSEIPALETLFSMLVPEMVMISHPSIVPSILEERKWMVSNNTSAWAGFVRSHLARFRKSQRQRLLLSTLSSDDGVARSGVLPQGGETQSEPVVGVAIEEADCEGVRGGKLLSHARRAIVQAEELLFTGRITFPLERFRAEEIRRLKGCQVPDILQKKSQSIAKGLGHLTNKAKISALPPEPDRSRLKALRDDIMRTTQR